MVDNPDGADRAAVQKPTSDQVTDPTAAPVGPAAIKIIDPPPPPPRRDVATGDGKRRVKALVDIHLPSDKLLNGKFQEINGIPTVVGRSIDNGDVSVLFNRIQKGIIFETDGYTAARYIRHNMAVAVV